MSRREVALVAAGGAVGALARHAIARAFPAAPRTFPTTTLLVNLAGAFLLGVLLEALARRDAVTSPLRPLLGIGLLGAFTTFSTFALEVATLVRDGRTGLGVLYATVALGAGLAAVLAGLTAGGWRPRLGAPPEEGES